MILDRFFKSTRNKKPVKIISKNEAFLLEDESLYKYTHQVFDEVYALLDFSDCIIDAIEIDATKNISSEIELKTYEDLSLDPTLDYVINYLSVDEIKAKYFVFVAKQDDILSCFQDDPIDFVAFAPLVISTLFTNNFLPTTNDFAFLHINTNDAFVAVYVAGNFTYCKGSQKLSFSYLSNRLNEILSERCSEADFIEFFLHGKQILIRDDYEQNIQIFWNEFFSIVSEILLHAKRTYKNLEYSAIFIGSIVGAPQEIQTVANDFFSTPVRPFDFLVQKHNSNKNMDILLKLLPLYCNDQYSLNFSACRRPPPFLKRDSGRFVLMLSGLALLGILYPVFIFGPYAFYLKYENKAIGSVYGEQCQKKAELETKIALLEHSVNQNTKVLYELDHNYSTSVHTLQDLANIKTQYLPRSITLVDISKLTSASGVWLEVLDINKTNVKLVCVAQSPNNIASLMQNISKHYNLSFGMPTVIFENGTYKAEVIMNDVGKLP